MAGRLDLKQADAPCNHRAKGDPEHRQVRAELTYGVFAGGLSIQNRHEPGRSYAPQEAHAFASLRTSKLIFRELF